MQGPDLEKRIEPRVLADLAGLRIAIGNPAPKPTLVIYSAVGCQPCHHMLGALPRVVENFANRIAIVLVCRGSVADVRAFTANVPNEVVVCPDEEGIFAKRHQIFVTPYAFSLDESGRVRYKGVPGSEIADILRFVVPVVADGETDHGGAQLLAPAAAALT